MQIEHLFGQALGIIDPWYIDRVHFAPDLKRLNIYVNSKKGATFSYDDEGKQARSKTIRLMIRARRPGAILTSLNTSYLIETVH